jgi:DNA-binding LacI/PurR family transcriptional regulator/DNA-binding transcriptional regulator YhcF (GntR family)
MVQQKDHRGLDGPRIPAIFPAMGGDIERRSIAAQLADRIEREIRSGTWTGELPGKRTLAGRYGVNVKTGAAAMDLLEQRGLLGPATAGRGREILAARKSRAAAKRESALRLLIIHPAAGHLSIEDFQLLHRMGDTWERSHGEVVWARVDYPRCKRPEPMLDSLIKRHAADALLLYVPEAGWGRQAAARRPFYQIGGPYEADVPISLGAYAIDLEVQRVVKYLRDLGHRRILLPSESMGERMRRAIVEGLRGGGDSKPEFGRWEDYCPTFPESVPAAWSGYWKKSFSSLRPTAVVLFEDTHVLSLYGFCYTHGIRIPADLSVISIGYESRFEWCQPRPTMLRYPANTAVAHFQLWLEGGLKPIGRKFFDLEMIAGESVARPKP